MLGRPCLSAGNAFFVEKLNEVAWLLPQDQIHNNVFKHVLIVPMSLCFIFKAQTHGICKLLVLLFSCNDLLWQNVFVIIIYSIAVFFIQRSGGGGGGVCSRDDIIIYQYFEMVHAFKLSAPEM